MTADPTPTPAPDARPVADVMRELADAATDGRVTVHADTVRAWADEIERLMGKAAAPVIFPRSAPIYTAIAHVGGFRDEAIRAANRYFDICPSCEWVKISVSVERGPQQAYYYFRQGNNGRAELLTDFIEER